MTLLIYCKTGQGQVQALKRAEPATARATPTTSRIFLPVRNATRYRVTPTMPTVSKNFFFMIRIICVSRFLETVGKT